MRIVWVVEGVEPDGSGGYRSNLASNRYRAILPAQALSVLGHEVRFMGATQWLEEAPTLSADVVVMGKFLSGSDSRAYQALSARVLEQVRAVATRGIRVVADFNDDHFDHPLLGLHWRGLALAAQVIVAGSDAMAQRVRQFTSAHIEVVGDPVASPRFDPRTPSPLGASARWLHKLLPAGGGASRRIKLLWYGHPVNWPAMAAWLPALVEVSADHPILLWVVTQELPQIQSVLDGVNARHSPALLAELVPWDESTQWSLLEQCDAVLVPSDPADPSKAVKTANRLTDALHAGRYVIGSSLPSYQAWADYADLSNDPVEAIRRLIADPAAALLNVSAGQCAVAQVVGLNAIAQQWFQAFNASISPAGEPSVNHVLDFAVPPMPVRLNLGCGSKILPGFINVDFAENWSGIPPDVIADVTQTLPFPDEHADEVHAYHVLEHLDRWRVEACLKEWTRVLKPGGRLILELPCLDKVLAIFQSHISAGKPVPARLTMWALYGDPGYENLAMTHRWCYSVAELRDLLVKVGLVAIEEQEPQTHVAIRDMRLVARKS